MLKIYNYLKNLTLGRTVLWCYLIWYLVMVAFYFDPTPRIWLTSLGISAVIGIGLVLSVASPGGATKRDRWQLFRLFLMPFCVSSFSALVKDHGFILIFSPKPPETAIALSLCATLFIAVWLVRRSAALGRIGVFGEAE